MPDNKDRFGRLWPDVSPNELCPECGQPDNCGDCNHQPLSNAEVLLLGGQLPDLNGTAYADIALALNPLHEDIVFGIADVLERQDPTFDRQRFYANTQ